MSTPQFGGWLRHEREARGLTVEAIASQTKIPPRHLEALERGDTLPLPVFYQRAEVRAVARAVGVDEQLAVARLDAELAPVEPAPPAPPPSKSTARVRSEYVLAAFGGVVLVVVLAGWGSFERTAASEGTVETRQTVAAPPPAAQSPGEAPSAPTIETVAAPGDDAPVVPVGPTELVIRTLPAGAHVTVNGIGWGVSPVTIRHLEPGEKRVRVTMDGYTSTERSVTVDEGARETIRIRLGPS